MKSQLKQLPVSLINSALFIYVNFQFSHRLLYSPLDHFNYFVSICRRKWNVGVPEANACIYQRQLDAYFHDLTVLWSIRVLFLIMPSACYTVSLLCELDCRAVLKFRASIWRRRHLLLVDVQEDPLPPSPQKIRKRIKPAGLTWEWFM